MKPPPADQPQPKFACEATQVDLGKLWATGWQPATAWRFRNEGQAPLRIRMRYVCNIDPVGPIGFTILPGQSRHVRVKVKVAAVPDRLLTLQAVAHTNDTANRRIKLRAECTILDSVRVEPRRVKFEKFDRAIDQLTETVTTTRGYGGPIRPRVISVERRIPRRGDQGVERLQRIPVGHEKIDTRIREIEAGERYELTIIARPPWPPRGSTGAHVLLATGVAELPKKTVSVSIHPQARVECNPGCFRIPARLADAIERRVTLRWSTDRPPALAGRVDRRSRSDSPRGNAGRCSGRRADGDD